MKAIAALTLAALGATSFAQIKFDDITMRNMSPQWSTVLVGSYGNFTQPCQFAVTSYDQWCQMWPTLAGPYYVRGMEVPRFVDWNTEQIVFISLGNAGAQGYGMYVEDIRRTSSFGFDVNFVISAPNVQVGGSFQQSSTYQSFSFGGGLSPFVAIRVPRYYGMPSFHSRFCEPPSYVIRSGSGYYHQGNCQQQKVWMFGKGGVLIPYTAPGQDKKTGGI